ncbi:hypothetical protein DPMN_194180 [Dreissena polymorpha]|uniref:Uncharacterized protein n=1 Tax=Dreissena polymorpha TaxID=45954 RepID=A0A9D3Y2H3_DREPO|nr:hypothetical protein DPMN_194180 [Dreissena polymorpha]
MSGLDPASTTQFSCPNIFLKTVCSDHYWVLAELQYDFYQVHATVCNSKFMWLCKVPGCLEH